MEERREQPQAGPGRRPGGVAGGSPGGADCEGGGAVVQRTQVLLLSGEPWGLDGGQTVLSSFAHHVLPPSRPAEAPGPPTTPEAAAATLASSSSSSGQLVFFLCRAASLRERPGRLREVLEGVCAQVRGSPAVLVGVVVQPPPSEEREALLLLEDLLRDVFEEGAGEGGGGGAPHEVHTAVFAPGRPDGALQLQRLRPHRVPARTSVTSVWSDTSNMVQILGASISLVMLAYGSYYFYTNPPL